MKRRGRTAGYKREPLTSEEANRLRAACQSPGQRLVVWLLLDTGLRVSELCGLAAADLDYAGHRLTVTGKGQRRRVLPIPEAIRGVVERHYVDRETLGVTPRTVQRMVRALATAARISRPLTPHVLRHTFAVAALQKGLSLPALQWLLGHADLKTTALYLNLSPEEALREYRAKW